MEACKEIISSKQLIESLIKALSEGASLLL